VRGLWRSTAAAAAGEGSQAPWGTRALIAWQPLLNTCRAIDCCACMLDSPRCWRQDQRMDTYTVVGVWQVRF
jgi:hypothetical protein